MKKIAIWMLVFLGFNVEQAGAQLLVNNTNELNPSDILDWGNLAGGVGTTRLPSFSFNSTSLSETSVVSDVAGFELREEGNPTGSGWFGNFGLGSKVLYDRGGGPITIIFSSPVDGAGFQIQSSYYQNFNASIEAFDLANNSLGIVSKSGISNGNEDNSAPFIGILAPNISKVVIDTTDTITVFSHHDFGIGEVFLTIPEPNSLALLAVGVLFAGCFRIKSSYRSGRFDR